MKICNKCNKKKELSNFYFRKDNNEYRKECKECFLKICKKYRYGKNREKILKNKLIWQRKNPEKKREAGKRYFIKNREKINKYNRYYKREKQSMNARIIMNYRGRIYKALKKNIGKQNKTLKKYGGKQNKTLSLLGCSIEFLKKHLEKQFKEGMNWNNYGKWHLDHIIPCASFDFNDEEQQKKCFNFINLQPLWARENRLKSNKLNWKIK